MTLSPYNAAAAELAEKVAAARAEFAPAADIEPAKLFPAHDPAALGVAREYEAMGGRPVSARLEARASSLGVHFEHLGLTIGSVLHGLDLSATLAAAEVDFIRDVLLERKVVFFRDQHLSESQQVAFGRLFGELDAFPFGRSGDDPFILEIEHGPLSPGTENGWHTDVTWMESPSLGSIAQCVVVPPVGGDTLFADSYAAYQGLPEDLRERVQHLSGINDYRIFLGSGRRRLPEALIEEYKRRIPFGVSHPLLRTHPETGKTALYIHGGFLRHDSLFDSRTDDPLDPKESREIVARLLARHGRPEYVCRFRWTAGSIAFWDNRAAQHYAASDYYPHRRLLRRVTVSGDRPFYAGADPAS